MSNPFTVSFGKSPLEEIERPTQINEIIDVFSAQPIDRQIYIITGIRGSGKTVMMSSVAKRFKAEEDWIVVELNPETDMLRGLAAKLCSESACSEIFRRAKLNLSLLGFGIEISGEPPISDIESALDRMLESLKKKGKRVLVTVDEATNNSNVRIFAAAFQIFVRHELPLFLLMTGLYENIEDLQDEKSLTFLYRAPKIHLKPLNMFAIASRYRSLFHLDESDARKMASVTKGYPFAFQVLGYLTWRGNCGYDDILPLYRQYLEEYVYDKIWSELSAKDREAVIAIAKSGTGKVSDILLRLDSTAGKFSPYRDRLIKKGIVSDGTRGYLSFTLPLFGEYAIDKDEI